MDYLTSWQGVVVAGLVLVALELFNLVRGHTTVRRTQRTLQDQHELVVRDFRRQIQELKDRAHDQMSYFLNYSEAVRDLCGAVGVGEVATACFAAVKSLLQTNQVAILLVDDGGRLRLFEGSGFPTSMRQRYLFPSEEGERVLSSLLEAGVVTILDDHPRAKQCLAPLGEHWELAAPVWSNANLLGLMLVSNPSGDELARRVLAMLADLTAVALTSARDVDKLKRSARGRARKSLAPVRQNGQVPRSPVFYAASWAPAPQMPTVFGKRRG